MTVFQSCFNSFFFIPIFKQDFRFLVQMFLSVNLKNRKKNKYIRAKHPEPFNHLQNTMKFKVHLAIEILQIGCNFLLSGL